MDTFPEIHSRESLIDYLREELGYCGCAGADEALQDLELTLRYAKAYQEVIRSDDEESKLPRLQQLCGDFTAQIGFDQSPGTVTWFLYTLEMHDLIWHSYNITMCQIT